MFVRYQAADPSRSGRHQGVFALANGLAREGRLSTGEYEWWRTNNAWLDTAYPDPAKSDPTVFDRAVHPLATCWFKAEAQHLLVRVPGYLRLLDAHGVAWAEVWSSDPGPVIYEDDVQIVAA